MLVKEILRDKGRAVVSIPPEESVAGAMKIIVEEKIGALMVMEGDKVLGIVTERDIFRLICREREKAFSLPIADIMTRKIVIGVPDDHIDALMAIMTNNRFRHVPIMDGDRLVGLVSIGDLVKSQVKNLKIENRYLIDYITGKYPA
jgi:CBS domain-containing protein